MHTPNPQEYEWCPSAPIKVESSQQDLSLFSPPSSPHISPPLRRKRSNSSVKPRRAHPYLSAERDRRSRTEPSKMATNSTPYGYWPRGGMRSQRSSSDNNEQGSNSYTASALPSLPAQFTGRSPMARPPSQSSSSLTNAMGDVRVSPQAARSPSPQDIYDSMAMNSAMSWNNTASYPGVAGSVAYFDTEPTVGDTSASGPYPLEFRNVSPDSPTGAVAAASSSSFLPNDSSFPSSYMGFLPESDPYGMSSPADETHQLRRRLQQFEHRHREDRARIARLEAELSRNSTSSTSNPLHSQSPAFQSSWNARTDARIRQFCSLNRAGNALCSWHDSRRERRKYPPRMAPPGVLNCGCTYEQALFEESLSRHSVGSYHPGPDAVRMDPALRNPLLKLLQWRYNYRDGDFEREPVSGDWVAGEGPGKWEQRIQAGVTNPRRPSGK